MTSGKPEQQRVAEKLQDALERLQHDVRRVEVWAGALTGFAQPVPDYAPPSLEKHRLGQPNADATGTEPPPSPEKGDPR